MGNLRLLILISSCIMALDQFTKFLVQSRMNFGSSIVVIKGLLDISYVTNDGAAFGLFRGWNPIFIMVTFIAIVFIFVYYRQFKDDLWMRIALGFLLGGAVGNLIDRIRINQVIDFINFRWWPSFNVADISVCIGAGMLLIRIIRGEGKPKKTDETMRR